MKKPIAAILYDFDSTLAKSDMQNFGFIPALGLSPAEFWSATTRFAEESGVERTLSYLYMMVKMTKERGIKMTREWLRDMGRKIEFFPGVHTWFKRINDFGKEHGVSVEHYLISSGNMEILEGCGPKLASNFTQKTQYFFRISKGVYDANDDAGVNEKRPDRRIPYTNIIYIGDGMTDIPAMIIAKNNGGKSIAVYPQGKREKVEQLYQDGRVNYVCQADYSQGRELEKVLHLIIQGIAINESLGNREAH